MLHYAVYYKNTFYSSVIINPIVHCINNMIVILFISKKLNNVPYF